MAMVLDPPELRTMRTSCRAQGHKTRTQPCFKGSTCFPVRAFQYSSSRSAEWLMMMDESSDQSTPRTVALWPVQRATRA